MKRHLLVYYLFTLTCLFFNPANSISQPITSSSSDFTGVQGQDNWYYGMNFAFDYAGFTLLPNFTGFVWNNPGTILDFPQLDANGGHPQIENLRWAVRRWVSPLCGQIQISGDFYDRDGNCGDGAHVRIFHNGVEVYQFLYIPLASTPYSLNLTVSLGDTIDFAIDPIFDAGCDDTHFTANISLPAPPPATKHIVCSVEDSGPCTLRELVSVANPGDTICFDPCLDGIPILLDSQVVLNKNLVIIGNDTTNTIIDGNFNSRIFEITEGDTVEMWRMKLQNGLGSFISGPQGYPENQGGGILNLGVLSVFEAAITGCGAYAGGGILNGYQVGRLNLKNVALIGNVASTGGGMYNHYQAIVTEENVLYSGNGAYTGGGFTTNGTITQKNVVITDNVATYGGGLWNVDGVMTQEDVTISDNTGTLQGGGILNERYALLKQKNVTISGNRNYYIGGGIYNLNNSTVIQENVTISGNLSRYGGGIFNWSTAIQKNVTIVGNKATEWGGGVCNFDTLTQVNVTISGNTADTAGGGLYNSGTLPLFVALGMLEQTNVTITGNSAPEGGGVYNAIGLPPNSGAPTVGGLMTMTNVIVWDNNAPASPEVFENSTQTYSYSVVKGMDIPSLYPGSEGNLDGTLPLSDPLLGPLQDNGGPTQTHALLCGSGAYNAAHPDSMNLDQRGFAVFAGRRDMGAYESQGYPTDNDLDGFCTDSQNPDLVDCDDDDPDVNPGAKEICNNIDDDCDGTVGLPDVGNYCCIYGQTDAHFIASLSETTTGMSNPSMDDDGYGDYTHMMFYTVNPYFRYLYFVFTPGNYGPPDLQSWKMYIDFNNNDMFEPAEKVMEYCTSVPFARFINLQNQPQGEFRMRLVMQSDTDNDGCQPGEVPSDLCGTLGDGEAEDYMVRNGNGNEMQVQPPVQGQFEQATLEVFPNPFGDEFYVMIPAFDQASANLPLQLALLNAQGQTVLQETRRYVGDPVQINASSLPSGTYFLRVNTGSEVLVRTLVKE